MPTRLKIHALVLLLLVSPLAGCATTATVMQRKAAPTATPSPPGTWCLVASDGLPTHQAFTPACEIFGNDSAAGSEGPTSTNEKLGGVPVAETCWPAPCLWGADRATAAQVTPPWAIVATCTPNTPSITPHITLFITLVFDGHTFYSWGMLPCPLTYPNSFYEFHSTAPGLAAVQLVTPLDPGVTDWDVVLVQR